ncbi:MAG: helix-turn-helix transcriptional regulator [Clostridia bacterium]|nr:helix-turn-helix transcriptional regulator [Clostridia bacterium]
MSAFTDASSLIFFKTEKYQYKISNIFDASYCPRPHYCIGLILSGEATFKDSSNGDEVLVKRGDIIFVPMGSRYVSLWTGDPDITYVSMHFAFDKSEAFPQKSRYRFCRISLPDYEKTEKIFLDMLAFSKASDIEKLALLGNFYSLLSEILPCLTKKEDLPHDIRLERVISYIESSYSRKTSVEELARLANMSVSRFFPYFKNEFGVTPIDYINSHRVGRAIILLMNDSSLTVESVSEAVGFESSAYFRRVFKSVTGYSPRQYRKISSEL